MTRHPQYLAGIAALLLLLTGGSAFAQPAPTMIARYDAGGLDLGEGVAIASNGNVVVTGIGERQGQQDFVTVMFDPSGKVLWTATIDEGKKDRGAGVAIDPAGNVYVVGTVHGAGDDVMLAKYTSSGVGIWTTRFDRGTSETARAITLDAAGNILIVGTSLSPNGGDGFVAKFDPEGNELWARPVNVFWLDEFFAVTTDRSSNVVAVGRVARDGNFDVIARKFTPTGDVVWTQYVTGSGLDDGRGVATDPDGNVYVTGTTSVVKDGKSTTDILLAKISVGGTLVWKKNIDVAGGEDEGRAAVSDPSGNILVTGFSSVKGNKDPFVMKLDTDGNVIWRQTTPGTGIDGTGSIAISRDGRLVALGGATQRDGRNFDFLAIVYEQGRPLAAFDMLADKPTSGKPISFLDSSAPDLVPIVSWHWDFGDGTNGTSANPSHSYEYGGTYVVRLTVADSWGSADRAQRTITIAGPPAPGAAGTEPTPAPTPDPGAAIGQGVGAKVGDGDEKASRTPWLGPGAIVLAAAVVALLAPRRERL